MAPRPLIIAHRGGKFWEGAEFSYISESVREGADIIELDIRVRNGEYIVQHDIFNQPQGHLKDALNKTGGLPLYLDIKDRHIDIEHLINFVHSVHPMNHIIIGSYDVNLLRKIKKGGLIETNCHCFWPWNALARGRKANADWINPMCYVTTRKLAGRIIEGGHKFTPSGNQIFKKHEILKNQAKYARWGAHAVSAHHVKELKRLLENNIS